MDEARISTSGLLRRLTRTKNITGFIKRYDKQTEYVPFSEVVNSLCAERKVTPAQAIKQSGIERTYGHQLFNGNRTPSRDNVIRLAFGFEMDYNETQTLLKRARKSALYPKLKRDAVVIFALNRKLNIMDVQLTLDELGLPLLGKEERTYE